MTRRPDDESETGVTSQPSQGFEFGDVLEVIGAKPPNLTPEEWEEHDRRVRELRAAEAERERLAWASRATDRLAAGGAPKALADIATHDLDPEAPAVRELLGVPNPGGGWSGAWNGRGLVILSGPVGVGKTLAALAWTARFGGTAPRYLRAATLEARGRYDKAVRERWESASSLVLDDLGIEWADAKGNYLVALEEIADKFHGDAAPLIITTNLLKADFKERYEDRITSRVRGDSGWRTIDGPDRRSGLAPDGSRYQ